MLRVGLGERTLELLRAAVADEETVARFRAKVLTVPGMDCLIFTGGGVGSWPRAFLAGTRGSPRHCRDRAPVHVRARARYRCATRRAGAWASM